MTEIRVSCEPDAVGWACTVELSDPGGSVTRHRVAVSAADIDRLAPGADDPSDLVSRSFAFLLEREPKESILTEFDLTVIARYFPDYETEIRTRT